MDGLVARLAGLGLSCAWTDNPGDESSLHPEELPAIASATSARRRAEFAAGRATLRDALALAGLDHDGPLPAASSGEAVLPAGWIHSLSHTHSASGILACAVVGPAARWRGVGLDVERLDRPLKAATVEHVTVESERARLAEYGELWPRPELVIFSAKEAVFKALFPLVRKRFWFDAAEIEPRGADAFSARLLTDLGAGFEAGTVLDGMVFLRDDWVATVVVVVG